MTPEIHGIQLDECGRCRHYHSQVDVVALWCGQCRQFWACYQCHDACCDHAFVPLSKAHAPVLCGACRQVLTYVQYQQGACPFCGHAFNPRCALHAEHYFQ